MDQTEQQYIDALFDRLAGAERQSGPRDADAERYIREQISHQPAAPYYMAQTMIVQDEALKAAQQRIEELERELKDRPAQQSGGGSFLGGLFGGGGAPSRGTSVPASGSVPRAGGGFSYPQGGTAPMESPVARYGQGGGGGFLAGAMQTAVGVAGGVVLGNMIGGLLGGEKTGTAHAGEAGKDAAASTTDSTPADTNNTPDQNQDNDPFADVEETQYNDNDSFLGGDFDDSYDI